MNVYQLVPVSCYDVDDDGGGNSEFWSPEMLDAFEDGRASRSGFYADAVDGNSNEEIGWYDIVEENDCTVSVPPVPRLLLDAAHLRFFDDDSSAENETFFGRTLDTISEEDEEDVTERVAAIDAAEADAKQHECSTYENHRLADLSTLA